MNTSEMNNSKPTAACPTSMGHPASGTVSSASDFAAVRYPCFLLANREAGLIKVYCLNSEDDAIAYGRRILQDFGAYRVFPTEVLEFINRAGESIPDDVILDSRTDGYAVRITDNVWLPASRAPSPITWLYECLQSRLNVTRLLVAYDFEETCTLFEDNGMNLKHKGDLLTYVITDTVAQNYYMENGFSLREFLSRLAIPVDICDGDRVTLLHLAAQHNDPIGAQYLIDEQVGIHFRDANDMTPLMYAAREGHLACIEVLLAADADWTSEDRQGKTALSIARDHEHQSVVAALETKLLKAQRMRPPVNGNSGSLGL